VIAGRVGVTSIEASRLPMGACIAGVRAIEELGYPTIWIPEGGFLKEAFANCGVLLASTERIVIATAIANIHAREPSTMANGAKTLAEAFPGRFVLGMGIGHAEEVESALGRSYDKPIATMRHYLDGMDGAPYRGPEPGRPAAILIAAMAPRMLALAAERTAGTHPYFVPVAHTAAARAAVGAGPTIAVGLPVVLDDDATRARATAREHAAKYLRWKNYRANLRRAGYGEEEIDGHGSDRLVEDIIVQGDAQAIRARVLEHLEAGADHVSVQPLPAFGDRFPVEALTRLAPALLDL